MSTKGEVIHYAGALSWFKANGARVQVLPGWPSCCNGSTAVNIKHEKRYTYNREKVTCKRCLSNIAASDSKGTPGEGERSEHER